MTTSVSLTVEIFIEVEEDDTVSSVRLVYDAPYASYDPTTEEWGIEVNPHAEGVAQQYLNNAIFTPQGEDRLQLALAREQA